MEFIKTIVRRLMQRRALPNERVDAIEEGLTSTSARNVLAAGRLQGALIEALAAQNNAMAMQQNRPHGS